MMDVREKLVELLSKYFDIGDSYAYNLTRVKSAFACGTMGFDDFEEFDEETVEDIASYLIKNGVTVQEWIPASEPPKDTYEYWIAYKAGGDYSYSTGYFNGKCWCSALTHYKILVTHWMPMPQPPKGE